MALAFHFIVFLAKAECALCLTPQPEGVGLANFSRFPTLVVARPIRWCEVFVKKQKPMFRYEASACFVKFGTSTSILDDNNLFSLELKYENPNTAFAPSGTTVTPQYGGNISQVVWKIKGREKQVYTLKYDSENRMTDAIYSDIAMSGTVTGNRYDEKLTYDIRGNIQTLQRWGLNGSCTWGMIDNLTYNYGNTSYNPKNQLQSVTDNSGDLTRGFKTVANGSTYTYDNNGNMTADPNKSITNITYNHLNLPITITFTGSRTISFMYDAGGNKLRKTVVQSGVTQYTQDYVGGIEYRNGVLEAIYHAEGRITNINSTLMYEYAMKDHLGNTRLMFADKNNDGVITQSSVQESNEVTQENHYYPFGLNMEGTWQNTPSVLDSKYQYNGKEFNDDFGLNMSDYGARMYDPAVGRWNVVDPLGEKYHPISLYAYVANNPMSFIDPNGKEIWIYYTNSDGNEDKMLYKANMEYDGDNAFIKASVKYLNGMNSSESGKSVLNDLTTSKNNFDFKNTSSAGGEMSLQFNYKD